MVVSKHVRGMYKPFLIEAIRLEGEVQDVLDKWEEYNTSAVIRHASSSGISNQQQLLRELLEAVIYFLAQYNIVMNVGIERISTVKAKQCLEESLPLLRMVQDTEAIESFNRDMKNLPAKYANWATIATGMYGLSFNDRLRGVEVSTERTIKNIITLSTKYGYGSKEVITVLKDYVNPNTRAEKPFDIARKALGASKQFRPKNVLAGSVQTNLYEITRNEASELWRSMTETAYKNADWVKGYTWELSGSHVHSGCVCEDYAEHGVYPKSEERPISHGNCYLDDTMVMTDKGWRYFQDLKGDELFYSLNPETREAEYVKAKKRIQYVSDKIIFIKGKSVDFAVTPDHQMLVENWNGRLVKRDASKLQKEAKFYAGVKYDNEDKPIHYGGYTWTQKQFAVFMGWYLSEGSAGHYRKDNRITISQYDKLDELYKDFEDMPFAWTKIKYGIQKCDKALCNELLKLGKSYEKYLPEQIFQLSKENTKIFLECFIKGDGCVSKSKMIGGYQAKPKISLSTSSPKLIADLCIIAQRCGYRPTIREMQNDFDGYKCRKVYAMNLNYMVKAQYKICETRLEKGKFNVGCVELEKNHTLLVMRNGKIWWCGNCLCDWIPEMMDREEMIKLIEEQVTLYNSKKEA